MTDNLKKIYKKLRSDLLFYENNLKEEDISEEVKNLNSPIRIAGVNISFNNVYNALNFFKHRCLVAFTVLVFFKSKIEI